jgi:hypothetical protein
MYLPSLQDVLAFAQSRDMAYLVIAAVGMILGVRSSRLLSYFMLSVAVIALVGYNERAFIDRGVDPSVIHAVQIGAVVGFISSLLGWMLAPVIRDLRRHR